MLVSQAEITFTGIFSLARPCFSLLRITAQTLSAASLLQALSSRNERTISQSVKESESGSFLATAMQARSANDGLSGAAGAKCSGGALWVAAAATSLSQPSSLP